MKDPTFFDVLSHMSRTDNKALRLSPVGNISSMRYGKRGTAITIGFPGNVIKEITLGESIGGFLLIRKDEYEKAKAELITLTGGVK